MADVIETPVVDAPSSMDFETYVQSREADMTAPIQAAEDIEDTPSEADPAPAETPEGEATPAQETAKTEDDPEPPTTESTPEDKGKKKEGIPQSRLDEVTKARREAERERDALKAESEQLKRDLEAARKPADKPATTPAPVETKPETQVENKPRPKMPKLDDPEIDGDFDKLQEKLETYHEELTDWKYDQRSSTEKKQAETARVAKEAADKTAAEKAKTEGLQSDFVTRVNSAKEKHSDWEEVMNRTTEKPLYSPAMSAAIRGFDDPGEIAYFLASNPEESQKIAELTAHKDGLAPEEYQRLLVVASRELSKVESKLAIPALESKPTEITTPPTVKTTTPPPKQKPLASSAPKPPTPVTPTNTNPPNPKESMSLEDYEKARTPQIERRNRR